MRPTRTTSLETHSLSTQTSNIHRESLRTVEISSPGSNLQLNSPHPRSGTRNVFRSRFTPHPANTRNADVPVGPSRLRPTNPTPSLEKSTTTKSLSGKTSPHPDLPRRITAPPSFQKVGSARRSGPKPQARSAVSGTMVMVSETVKPILKYQAGYAAKVGADVAPPSKR
jgi:hypothetical protein